MCSGVQVRSVSIIQVLYNEQYFFMRVRFFASVVGKNKETRSHHSLYVPKKQIVYIYTLSTDRKIGLVVCVNSMLKISRLQGMQLQILSQGA